MQPAGKAQLVLVLVLVLVRAQLVLVLVLGRWLQPPGVTELAVLLRLGPWIIDVDGQTFGRSSF